MKKIEIKCTGTEFKKIDELSSFQGDLKQLSNENKQKLKNAILKHGFISPIFIWKYKNINYILDGHQRINVLKEMVHDGYVIPDLPIVYISADTKKEAKERLLLISSKYGDFTQLGFENFIVEDLCIEDIRIENILNNIKEFEEKEEVLNPYTKTHILLSIDIKDYEKVKIELNELLNNPLIEVEYANN